MDYLGNPTFRSFGMTPGDPTKGLENLQRLNTGLLNNVGLGPVYGLGEIYYIDRDPLSGDPNDQAIQFLSGNYVIGLPGCKLIRPYTFNNGNGGVVSGGTNAVGLTNARWIGVEFIGEQNPMTGEFPTGHVFRIIGNNVWIEDVIINGFGAKSEAGEEPDEASGQRGAIAMALSGDRITLVRPRIISPFEENSAGIRVFGGTGFRCYGGEVASGGDAALQLSTGSLDGADNNGIFDAAYIGTNCTSQYGRLMLVGTSDTPILGGRFERVSGTANNDGECIRIQNNSGNDPAHPQAGVSIAELDFLDVLVKRPVAKSGGARAWDRALLAA